MERDGASSNDASAKDLVLKILLVGAPKSVRTARKEAPKDIMSQLSSV